MNRDLLEQVERIQRITSELETAGELARVESRLLRVEVSERTAARRGAESDAHQARARVLSLLGLPATADIELIPTLTVPTDLPGHLDLHDLLDQLVVSNTSLAVKRADYQVAEEALRLEVQKQYPDITIGPGFGREDDDRLLLGVSLPIPILNANRGSIAEARLQRDGARAEVEVTYEYLANSLASALTLLDSVRAQRLMYQDQITPMLAAQAEEIEQLAQFGEINTLLTLDTISRQFIAKQRLLDLHTNELRTAIAITHLLGPEADPLPASVTEVDTHLRPVAPHTYPNGAGGNS